MCFSRARTGLDFAYSGYRIQTPARVQRTGNPAREQIATVCQQEGVWMKKRRTYTLRFILEMLVVFSVLATILIEVISSLHVNRTSLSSNYLENNYHYAKKLAKNTTDILTALQNNIDAIAKQAGDKPLKNTDLQAWYMANRQYFHSLLIADATGHIQAVSPAASGVTAGTLLTSHAARLALSTIRCTAPGRSTSSPVPIRHCATPKLQGGTRRPAFAWRSRPCSPGASRC